MTVASSKALHDFKFAYAHGKYRKCLALFDSFYKEWKNTLSKKELEVVFAIVRELDSPQLLFF